MTMTKREPKKERMALIGMTPGRDPFRDERVECDYCRADATWRHWASKFNLPDRDAYACDTHVGLLNPYYA